MHHLVNITHKLHVRARPWSNQKQFRECIETQIFILYDTFQFLQLAFEFYVCTRRAREREAS
jgi:hypothetical protein